MRGLAAGVLVIVVACSGSAGRTKPPEGALSGVTVDRRPMFGDDTPAVVGAEGAVPMCWASKRLVAVRSRDTRANELFHGEILVWDDLDAPPKVLPSFETPGTVACAASGDRVAFVTSALVLDRTSSSIQVVDLPVGGQRTVAGLPPGVASTQTTIALSPDGGRLAVAVQDSASGRAWIQRVDDGVVIASVALPPNAGLISVWRDDRVEFGTHAADGRLVATMWREGATEMDVVEQVADSPDHLFVVRAEVGVLDITGIEGTRTRFAPRSDLSISVRDGINNLFSGRGPQWVGDHGLILGEWVLDLERMALRRLVPQSMTGWGMTAPDGRVVVVSNGVVRWAPAP